MFSRRQLRVLVMQSLYAFFSSSEKNVAKSVKELKISLDKVYELYIYLLLLLREVHSYSRKDMEFGKRKKLPGIDDLNPKTKFINNELLNILNNDSLLNKLSEKYKFSWNIEEELIKNIFLHFKKSEEYINYVNGESADYEIDKNIAVFLFNKYIGANDLVANKTGEVSVYWEVNYDLVVQMVIRTISGCNRLNSSVVSTEFLNKEDNEFVENLFTKTIQNSDEYGDMVGEKAKNWEEDRIAIMDKLLMKMAICEFLQFPQIPIKVTMNEYIDISKLYSAKQSKVFINGILDKLLLDFKSKKLILKEGRGLNEL